VPVVEMIGFDETQRAVITTLEKLCQIGIPQSYIDECDANGNYPQRAMDELALNGWSALAVPEEYGGTAASCVDLVAVQMTLAHHALCVAQAYYSLWVLPAELIARVGTRDQQEAWLPRIASGEAKIAFALTEPDSGSDAAKIRTRMITNGDDSVQISGQKVFTSGAAVADLIITVVRSSESSETQGGLSLVMVDPASPGVEVKPIRKMGLKPLDLCEVYFDDVKVDKGAVLGPKGEAWRALQPTLTRERALLAAICTGALRDVLELSSDYARTREAFGQPISQFQMIADKIVQIRLKSEAAELLTLRAAGSIDAGLPQSRTDAALAKLFASTAYVDAAREGVQIFGGYGYSDEYRISRHYRDSKYLEIGGGTSEILKVIIARSMNLL
jgi:alkylation response protein AidB-like acyl-CoA dehydrogenase